MSATGGYPARPVVLIPRPVLDFVCSGFIALGDWYTLPFNHLPLRVVVGL